ncbi:MAG: DUF58 domain-containing protein [Microbacteriaceae bacterium]|nr:DUF58 domain-containing protein [Microbacteriaceae bacterium]
MARERRDRTERRDGETLLRKRAAHLTRRGWATLGIGALCLILGYTAGRREILVVAGMAVLLVVIGALIVRARKPRFDIIRLFSPPLVAAGSTTRVTVRIRNIGSSASTPLLWNDAIPWDQPMPPHELGSIPIGSAARRARAVDYDLHPPRRGLYPIGPFVAEYEDPFGMIGSVRAVGEADRLVVVPDVVELPAGGPALADGEGTAILVQRRVVGNDDDLTTREYRPGDALRRVHWRASARHGELMVRQEEHRSHPDARILVDTRQSGYPDAVPDVGESWSPAAHSEAFEWVVRMTASLGVHLEACGFRVGIEETAPPQIEPLGERWEGGRRVEAFLTSLAAVRLIDRPHDEVGIGTTSDPEGPVFALLSDPDEATISWLLKRRRAGQVAVAFVLDARAALRERLTEAGWQVVEVHEWIEPGEAWRDAGHHREVRA